MIDIIVDLRLLEKADHPARLVEPHDAQGRAASRGRPAWRRSSRRRRLEVRSEHVRESSSGRAGRRRGSGRNRSRLLEVAEILPDRVGGPLVPVGAGLHRLLGGEDLDEAAVKGSKL